MIPPAAPPTSRWVLRLALLALVLLYATWFALDAQWIALGVFALPPLLLALALPRPGLRAAFWAGLPFEERHQHPYYLSTYGEAVTGLPGLDAMVNIEPDWTIDLKFRNTTDHWIAVVLMITAVLPVVVMVVVGYLRKVVKPQYPGVDQERG